MTAAATDFERLLREALGQAAAKTQQADTDLVRLASEAADAVSKVTDGAAILELVPLDLQEDPRATYHLQLRKNRSEAPASDLGVFRLSETGYPIFRWATLDSWRVNSKYDAMFEIIFHDVEQIADFFKSMLSKPDSKLVLFANSLRKR